MQPPALPVPGPLALLDTIGEGGRSILAGSLRAPRWPRSAGPVLPASLELYLGGLLPPSKGTGPSSFIFSLPFFPLVSVFL